MKDKKEIEIINIQLFALVLTLFSSVISIIITCNQKFELEGKKELYSPEELLKITYFNRILIVILSIIFLYVNYKLYEISKEEGEDLKSYILQIIASIFTIIAGLIALYVVGLSNTQDIGDIENPII